MKWLVCVLLMASSSASSFVSAQNNSPDVKSPIVVPSTVNSDWILSLNIKVPTYAKDSKDQYISNCAAVLVKPGIALTAAHCVKNYCQQIGTCEYKVTQGRSLESQQGVGKIIRFGKHPAYNMPTGDEFSYDVAYIVLDVITTGRLASISLNNANENDLGVILGWGKTGIKNSSGVDKMNTVLNMGSASVAKADKCHDAFKFKYSSESTFCTEPVNKSEACAGDSGGPLILSSTLETDVPILLGIAKYESQDCDKPTKGFSAYTQASALKVLVAVASDKQAEYFAGIPKTSSYGNVKFLLK